MLLHSLNALCKTPGGAGSIWECLEAVVRATRVSGRVAYGFRTELHFADVAENGKDCADNLLHQLIPGPVLILPINQIFHGISDRYTIE